MDKLTDAIADSFEPAQFGAWVKTLLKTFIAAALVLVVAQLNAGTAPDWHAAAYAGAAAALAVVAGWLDPTDKRYGLGAQ